MLIHIATGTRVTEPEFVEAHQGTFPDVFAADTLASLGYVFLQYPPQPVMEPWQKAVEDGEVCLDGVWLVQWKVVDKDATEIAAAGSGLRSHRGALLIVSDWTQLVDAPVDKAAWAIYRQALRDLPSQTGFPWVAEWPVQPQ
jgi:hypothetical protein